jgi:DNA-binding PadR family transcriptional regulator
MYCFILKTLPSETMFNPNKRRPKLRMEILELIAIDGKMSVSKAESSLKGKHHHPEVSKAFQNLEENGFIKILDRNPGKGKLMNKGRQQIYYKITERGLLVLIRDYDKIMEKVIDPQTFWRVMMTFCYNSTKEIRLDKVEEFYELFLGKYLKYSSGHGYSFQLDRFSQMCDNWIQHRVLQSNRITLDQIVLEILAIRPGITLGELANMVTEPGVTREQIEKAISDYSPVPHKTAFVDVYGESDRVEYDKTDWRFQLHKTIVVKTDATGNNVYELSLFGVLLVQTVILYNQMNKLQFGLYYNDMLFGDYYDKIASNYQNKLPLIFGKWNLLKKVLRTMSAHNFSIILDGKARSDIMAKSFLEGGNKELYDSVAAVALHSQKQLSELFLKGIPEYFNYISDPDKQPEARKNTAAAFQMLLEVNILLDPWAYDPRSFQDLVKKEAPSEIIDPRQAEQMSHLYEIDIMEKAFAEEISFLYFLNLRNNYRFQDVLPMEYHDQKQLYNIDMKLSLTPMQYLLRILRHDKQIKELFSTWIQDLSKYQEEVLTTINDFYKEII